MVAFLWTVFRDWRFFFGDAKGTGEVNASSMTCYGYATNYGILATAYGQPSKN